MPAGQEATLASSGTGYRQELDRRLGLGHLLIFGMIFIVPIAPMAVYGFVAHESYGMVPLVYLVGIVAMFFTAFGYKELSREFPIAGSVYSYVQRGLHPYAGFIAGWMILADYLLTPSLIYAFSANWMHGLLPAVPTWGWVLVFVLINTTINILGIRLQARANILLLAVQLVALAIFLALAVRFVFLLGGGSGGWSAAPFFQPAHLTWNFVASAASIAALSFLGFDAISTLSEEAREPRRNIGRATVLTLLLLGAIFVLETYVASLAHPDYATLNQTLGFFQIGREISGQWLFVLLILVNVISAGIANALASQLAISRILYSMGRDRSLPFGSFFARVQPHFKTPVNAIIVVAIVSLILALWVPAVAIVKLVNFGALTAFMLLNVTVIAFFYIKKKERTKIIRYLLFPLLGFATVAFVWSGFDPATFAFGGAWLLAGLILGLVKHREINNFATR